MNKYYNDWLFSNSKRKLCKISIVIMLPAKSKYFNFFTDYKIWTNPQDDTKLSRMWSSYRLEWFKRLANA